MTTTMSALQRFFAAEAAYITTGGDFTGMAACLAPDVVMYQAANLPYGGAWHGRDGIERFMAAMSETWSSLEFLEQRFVVDGDAVVIYNVGRLRARTTGRVLDTSVMQLITFRDGLISEIRPFYLDTAAVMAAVSDTGTALSDAAVAATRNSGSDGPGH
ncbi:nuclear transport factor 2 family protein [Nocardia sp. CWNU-33]|uniref:nuclear transport factor 2 family protein n=1 Tax=Nocardia sp. CWNU-33 TaxID=3392117 RepID=UPI00398ECF1B